jgi:salicylate hydroxylase
MMPMMASGAGTAIEDAFILGSVLGRALATSTKGETLPRVTAALLVYDLIRRPLANLVQQRSRALSRIYSFVDIPEDEKADPMKGRVRDIWSWGKCHHRYRNWLPTSLSSHSTK